MNYCTSHEVITGSLMISYEGDSSSVFMTLEYRDELRNWEEVLPVVVLLLPQPL